MTVSIINFDESTHLIHMYANANKSRMDITTVHIQGCLLKLGY